MARRRRKRDPIPSLPRVVKARVGSRVVAEVTFGLDGESIRSVVLTADVRKLTGAEREAAAASVVRQNDRLDPKTDHDRIYGAIFEADILRGD